MKSKLNPLGFLSFVSAVAVLGIIEHDPSWFGYLGFLYYFRYFFIIPDEAFWSNIGKSAAVAFFAQLFTLAPLLFFIGTVMKYENYVTMSFGICFSIGILCFTLVIAVLECRESEGIYDD